MDEAIDRFLASPALSAATRRAYASDLRDFSAWAEQTGVGLKSVNALALASYTCVPYLLTISRGAVP